VWEWFSYEDQLIWEKNRAEIIAGLTPEMRKALGYE
jgi:hypothetical protein